MVKLNLGVIADNLCILLFDRFALVTNIYKYLGLVFSNNVLLI